MGHQVADTVAVSELVVVPGEAAGESSLDIQEAITCCMCVITPFMSSYHVTSLTNLSLRAMPAPASKMEE